MIDVEYIVKNAYKLATKTVEALGRVAWKDSINLDDIKRAYNDIYTDLLITHENETYILEVLEAYVSSLDLKTHDAPQPPSRGNSYVKIYTYWHEEGMVSDLLNRQAIVGFVTKELNYIKSCEAKLMVNPDGVKKRTQEAYDVLREQLVAKDVQYS